MNIQLKRDDFIITAGFDRIMKYTFMVIQDKKGEVLYSNLGEASAFEIMDFTFFQDIAQEKFNLFLGDINLIIEHFKLTLDNDINIEDFKKILLNDENFTKVVEPEVINLINQ